MEAEFLHEMFGLSIDHYVAVVAVEVGCHVVHRAVKRTRAVAGKVRERRAARRETNSEEGGTANERAGPLHNPGRRHGGRASHGEQVGRPVGRPFASYRTSFASAAA